ncbi:YbgC/FadM family acyl-CoA thioesterase [Limnohabitans sp. Rim11]|uniref:YbgC/FadM family acyl-CoA thioesterase n=1 Tax=Limnohabitans sp. Rim11 TaxID=1100719 RepID=UPI000B2DC85B|nr:YbgC/FadM family acyl-CoA thioesterase [Limnohabitans sp. Rim11]
MKRSDFRFFHRLRVRWAEIDMQKIVFNGHYLTYIDTAVTAYWGRVALPYDTAFHILGGELYVKKATLEYHASALMDDDLSVGMKCSRLGKSSMVFEAGIFRGDKLLISGELIYVFADPATQTSKPIPEALRNILLIFEAGESVVDLKTGNWDELKDGAAALRTEVFVEEQEIPQELEWDEHDAKALHALVLNKLGQPVATGRLLQPQPKLAQIGRMAVSKALRGGNLGRMVIDALVDAARQRGDHQVILHAQCSAEGFYRRLGFKAHGEVFQDAGIDHIEMTMKLV